GPLEGGKVDHPIAQIAENARRAGIVESGAVFDCLASDLRIDVLEMQIGNSAAVAAIERDWIKTSVDAVTSIETGAQDVGLNGIQNVFEFVFELDEPCSMGMDCH